MNIRCGLCILMWFIMFQNGLAIQQTQLYPLEGEIIHAKTGEKIPGATVFIRGSDTGRAADENGYFIFQELPAGEFELEFRSLGFKTFQITIKHPDEGFLNIELQPSVLYDKEVIVTSSPIGRNIHYQPVQALNQELLQKKASPSLGEILDGSPGVTTRSFGSAPSRPVIRGFDGDRVLVMQNGERMGDLSGTAVDHAVALDPLSMDRVEVVRGPASLLYGSSAIGGVVNLFSNDMPQDWDAGIAGSVASHLASVNSMGAGLIRAQFGTGQYAATGRLIYRQAGDLRTPEGRLPDTSIQNISYGGGLGYHRGPFETGLAMTGMGYTYGLPEAIDIPGQSVEIRMNRHNFQSISTIKTDHFFDFAELRIHYSDYHHDEFEVGIIPGGSAYESLEISFDQKTVSSSLIFRHQPVGRTEGAVGLSVNYSQIDVGGKEALTPNAVGYFVAGYIFEETGLTDFISLKTGIRMELKEMMVKTNELFTDAGNFDDRSDLILSGAVGLHYSPTPQWTAGIQVARAYRTPTVEELYSYAPHAAAGSFDIGNSALENEFSIGTDAFIEYQSDKISSQISLFANRIDNFVDFSPTGEIHTPSELPVFEYRSEDAVLYGFEVSIKTAISNLLNAGIAADYVRGRERNGAQNNLTYIPPFRVHLNASYDDGKLWLGPRLKIVNKQNKVAPNEESTDGYLLTGADAGYRFSHGVTLSFRLDNILNEKYRDHLSRVENRDAPMPGRNLNVMVRWNF